MCASTNCCLSVVCTLVTVLSVLSVNLANRSKTRINFPKTSTTFSFFQVYTNSLGYYSQCAINYTAVRTIRVFVAGHTIVSAADDAAIKLKRKMPHPLSDGPSIGQDTHRSRLECYRHCILTTDTLPATALQEMKNRGL